MSTKTDRLVDTTQAPVPACVSDVATAASTEKLVTDAERPQIVYTTKLGDPFHISKVAKALRLSEKHAATLVSLLLTATMTALAVLLAQPVWLLTAALWPEGQVSSSAPLLQGLWNFVSKDCVFFTGSAVSLFVFSIVYTNIAYLPGVALDLCDFTWSRRYKIQPNSVPTLKDIVKAVSYDTITLLGVSAPGLSIMWFRQGPWPYHTVGERCQTGCRGEALFPEAAPALSQLLFHLACCLIIFDFAYGFWHMLHHKSQPLYRHIHAHHHTYYMPFVFVTNYVTVAELAVVSLLSVTLAPAMGAHPLTQWVWAIVNIQLAVEAHLGYDFPFLLGNWLFGGRWILGLVGPKSHDWHHQHPRTNFFPFLSWGDRFFGSAWNGEEVPVSGRKTLTFEKVISVQLAKHA